MQGWERGPIGWRRGKGSERAGPRVEGMAVRGVRSKRRGKRRSNEGEFVRHGGRMGWREGSWEAWEVRGRWSRQGGGKKVRQEGLKTLSVCFAHELFESQSMLSRAELQNAMDAPKDLYTFTFSAVYVMVYRRFQEGVGYSLG